MPRILLAFAIRGFGLPLTLMACGQWSIGAPALAATVIGSLMLGFPAFRHFQRRGYGKLWQFAAGGAVLGLLVASPLLLSSSKDALGGATVFVPLGAIHAAMFWLIGIYRNQYFLCQL